MQWRASSHKHGDLSTGPLPGLQFPADVQMWYTFFQMFCSTLNGALKAGQWESAHTHTRVCNARTVTDQHRPFLYARTHMHIHTPTYTRTPCSEQRHVAYRWNRQEYSGPGIAALITPRLGLKPGSSLFPDPDSPCGSLQTHFFRGGTKQEVVFSPSIKSLEYSVLEL